MKQNSKNDISFLFLFLIHSHHRNIKKSYSTQYLLFLPSNNYCNTFLLSNASPLRICISSALLESINPICLPRLFYVLSGEIFTTFWKKIQSDSSRSGLTQVGMLPQLLCCLLMWCRVGWYDWFLSLIKPPFSILNIPLYLRLNWYLYE